MLVFFAGCLCVCGLVGSNSGFLGLGLVLVLVLIISARGFLVVVRFGYTLLQHRLSFLCAIIFRSSHGCACLRLREHFPFTTDYFFSC